MKKSYVRNYYNKCLLHSIHSYYVSSNIPCKSLYDIKITKTKANIYIYIYIETLVHIKTGYKENQSIKMKNISIENNYNYKEY